MRINHNISALNAWRSLDQVNSSMGKTLEKLSSGLRINRAGDDAAGLAISEKMRGQIKGLDMAVKNAQDAISLIQTAEGALTETHSILQRMRELSVQAASDTNTNVDRNQIQAEIDQLREEIDRIARTTEFNTMKLLDGKIESFRPEADVKVVTGGNFNLEASLVTIDVGESLANFTGTIAPGDSNSKSVSLNLRESDLGAVTVGLQVSSSTPNLGNIEIAFGGSDITSVGISIGDNSIGVTRSFTLGDLEFKFKLSDTNATTNEFAIQIDSIEVSLATSKGGDVPEGSYVVEVGQFKDEGTSPLDVRINYFNDEGLAKQLIVDFVNERASVAGDGKVLMTATTTNGFSVSDKFLSFTWDAGVYDIKDFNGALPMEEVIDSGVVRAEERWYKDTSLIFQIGANEGQNMVAGLDDMRAAALGLTNDSLKVTDQDSAERTVMVIDAAIHKVSSARAKIGAVQNRLEHTISNLGVASENLTAAESRIRDVDMAKEIMEFTKQQILMQSANAMLAQSNMIPQNVLQLLR
jgi:flagellin